MRNDWLTHDSVIIRKSAVVSVSKEKYDGWYAVCIDTAQSCTKYFIYDTQEDRDEDYQAIRDILFEEEEQQKAHDYEIVKAAMVAVWQYYGNRGDVLNSTDIRRALMHLDIDLGGYTIPGIYNDVAVRYGIITRLSRQTFKLNVAK